MSKYDLCWGSFWSYTTIVRFKVQAGLLILGIALSSMTMAQSASTQMDAIRYVAGYGSNNNSSGLSWATPFATLAAAAVPGTYTNSCPSSGGCVIHVAAVGLTITSTSALTLNRANTTIECEPGAIISTAVPSGNGPPITISANNTRITGCSFIYSSGNQNAITIQNQVGSPLQTVTIDHNTFQSYPGNTVVAIGGSNNNGMNVITGVNVTDNMFSNNVANHISILGNAAQINVSRNIITTGAEAVNGPIYQIINAQTQCMMPCKGTTTMQGLTIVGNIMFNNMAGDCIQVEQEPNNGGGSIYDVTVSSNVCTLQTPPSGETFAGGTGYSMGGVIGLTSVGNVFDANGQPANANGNPSFEFINVQNGTISSNSATLGSQSPPSTKMGASGILNIFTLGGFTNAATGNSFAGNTASVAFTPNPSTLLVVCFQAGTGGGSVAQSVNNNTFMGNSCDFTGSTGYTSTMQPIPLGQTVGFYMPGSQFTTIDNNFVSENNFIAPSGTNLMNLESVGISLQSGMGPMANNVVGFNNLTGFNVPYCYNLGSCAGTAGLKSGTVTNLYYGSPLVGPAN